MIEHLFKRKIVREFLKLYSQNQWPQVFSDVFEIGVLNLQNSFHTMYYSKEDFQNILIDLKKRLEGNYIEKDATNKETPQPSKKKELAKKPSKNWRSGDHPEKTTTKPVQPQNIPKYNIDDFSSEEEQEETEIEDYDSHRQSKRKSNKNYHYNKSLTRDIYVNDEHKQNSRQNSRGRPIKKYQVDPMNIRERNRESKERFHSIESKIKQQLKNDKSTHQTIKSQQSIPANEEHKSDINRINYMISYDKELKPETIQKKSKQNDEVVYCKKKDKKKHSQISTNSKKDESLSQEGNYNQYEQIPEGDILPMQNQEENEMIMMKKNDERIITNQSKKQTQKDEEIRQDTTSTQKKNKNKDYEEQYQQRPQNDELQQENENIKSIEMNTSNNRDNNQEAYLDNQSQSLNSNMNQYQYQYQNNYEKSQNSGNNQEMSNHNNNNLPLYYENSNFQSSGDYNPEIDYGNFENFGNDNRVYKKAQYQAQRSQENEEVAKGSYDDNRFNYNSKQQQYQQRQLTYERQESQQNQQNTGDFYEVSPQKQYQQQDHHFNHHQPNHQQQHYHQQQQQQEQHQPMVRQNDNYPQQSNSNRYTVDQLARNNRNNDNRNRNLYSTTPEMKVDPQMHTTVRNASYYVNRSNIQASNNNNNNHMEDPNQQSNNSNNIIYQYDNPTLSNNPLCSSINKPDSDQEQDQNDFQNQEHYNSEISFKQSNQENPGQLSMLNLSDRTRHIFRKEMQNWSPDQESQNDSNINNNNSNSNNSNNIPPSTNAINNNQYPQKNQYAYQIDMKKANYLP